MHVIKAIPARAGNTSWAQPSSYRFYFKGIPKHSIVATFTVGVAWDEQAQKVWHDGMRETMRRLEPSRVLLYGKNIGFDFDNCEVVEYKASGFHGRLRSAFVFGKFWRGDRRYASRQVRCCLAESRHSRWNDH